MYNVCIVEDEAPVRRKLEAMVNATPGFAVVESAKDGQTALNAIRERPVDIVITDIRIPIVTGLELAACLREQGSEIEIIVISGFNEFEYARTSLSLQVQAYLLKPVGREDLQNALRRCDESIRNRRQQTLRDGFPCLLFNNVLPSNWTLQLPCCLLLICIGSFPLTDAADYFPGSNELTTRFTALLSAQREPRSIELICASPGFSSHETVFLLCFSSGSAPDLTAICEEALAVFGACALPVHVIASPVLGSMEPLAKTHVRMRDHLKKRMLFAQSKLLLLEDGECAPPVKADKVWLDQLLLHLRHRSYSAFVQMLRQKLNRLEAEIATQRLLAKQLIEIADRLNTAVPEELRLSGEELHQQIYAAISSTVSYCALWERCLPVFRDLYQQNEPELFQVDKLEETISKIKAYIQKHIEESISGHTIATQFGFSAAYLSRVFHKQIGVSLTAYIIDQKIKRAVALFGHDPTLSVKQVSYLIGYSDPFYFSKRFKKLTGYAPATYKKMLEQGEVTPSCLFTEPALPTRRAGSANEEVLP